MTSDPHCGALLAPKDLSPLSTGSAAWVSHRARSRRARHAERQQMVNARPLRGTMSEWSGAADLSPMLSGPGLAEALRSALRRERLVIAVSHDDYVANTGGIQNAIGDEQRAFGRLGWAHLHVSPAAPLPLLADPHPEQPFRVKLRLDGVLLGVVAMQHLIRALSGSHRPTRRALLVVHHMLGHLPEALTALSAAARADTVVWLHDYFTLCPNYTLLQNGHTFCGVPVAHSTGCADCVFGQDRAEHLTRLAAFFAAVRPTVIAPSLVALALWRERNSYPTGEAIVLPYARLVGTGVDDGQAARPVPSSCALRVAFVGTRAFHKGWAEYEDLALGLAGDQRYEFYHFGSSDHPSVAPLPDGIRHVPTQVTAADRNAMIQALEHHRIDAVIIWSIWPETFCFVAYEALAAGAYVVTSARSGNVGAAIQAHDQGQGCVLSDESALNCLFTDGDILVRVAQAKRSRSAVVLNNYTADPSLLLRYA